MIIKETATYIRLKGEMRDNFPEYIIVHHTNGGTTDPKADTSNHTAQIVEQSHIKERGFNGIGYTFFIEKDGDIWAGRPEHYHGAHTLDERKILGGQKPEINYRSIGICLAGNFDVTLPTDAQIASLKELLAYVMKRYAISKEKVVPHRHFSLKSCYGNKLSDTWVTDLLTVDNSSKKAQIKALSKQISDIAETL